MAITFVGGVHGVGKSTYCQKLAERTGFEWLTASALIKAESQSAITEGSKFVHDPAANQDLLVRAVQRHMGSSHRRMILDGHFTLLKPDGEIIAINVDVFALLGIDTIIVLRDDPTSICNRLLERDKQEWPVHLVSAHQDAEINWAHAVASDLGIPISTHHALETDGPIRAIYELEK